MTKFEPSNGFTTIAQQRADSIEIFNRLDEKGIYAVRKFCLARDTIGLTPQCEHEYDGDIDAYANDLLRGDYDIETATIDAIYYAHKDKVYRVETGNLWYRLYDRPFDPTELNPEADKNISRVDMFCQEVRRAIEIDKAHFSSKPFSID